MTTTKKKRKLRLKRLKLRFPQWNTNTDPSKPRKKRKLRLKKEVLFLFLAVIVMIGLFMIPNIKETNALRDLGYTTEEIKVIREKKLTKQLLENQWYSPFLAKSLMDGTLNTDYLDLYTVISEEGSLTGKDFLLYNRLVEKGYTPEQLRNIFQNLYYYEMTPLLVFDYQVMESTYIDDCLSHRETNSPTHFELSGSYYTPYDQAKPADSTNMNMLVNKTYYLEPDYTPNDIAELAQIYAAPDRYLQREAADALNQWGEAGRSVGVTFYATSAYRDYESQEKLYASYQVSYGQEETDRVSARAGFSEHQTGLTVDIAATNEDNVEEFKDTMAYTWTSTNSHDYGWILRYPEGKEQITGYEFESWHYRYLGSELATAVYESNLTYDEYYLLYLKEWDHQKNVPSEDILKDVENPVNRSFVPEEVEAQTNE